MFYEPAFLKTCITLSKTLKLLRHKRLLGVDKLGTVTVLMSDKRNEETGGQ